MKRLAILPLVAVLASCEPVEVAQAPNPTVTFSCRYPMITPRPETEELQRKGGINISLAVNNFDCGQTYDRVSNEVPSLFDFNAQMQLTRMLQNGAGGTAEDYMLVETVSTPVAAVSPERFEFRVRINNQMSRVFRGAGTVVIYNFGGRNTSISAQDYEQLTNVLIPPQTEQDVIIYGPPVEDISDNTILEISFYDVVTDIDNAGNVTGRQNFTWYYDFNTQVQEMTGEVVTTKEWVRRR